MAKVRRAIAAAACERCNNQFSVEYRRLGSVIRCSACREFTLVAIPSGAGYPNTEWELTYRDFLRLIGESSSREAVGPLLREWFGYRVEAADREVFVRNSHNQAIDTLWLHLTIQDEPEKQYRLYQTAMSLAMSLWR